MRKSIPAILVLSLLLTACTKKAPPASSEAVPSDGVSSVPTAAERATDLQPVENAIAGNVKEVKAKVIDKEADDKTKGLIRVKVLEANGPVDIVDNSHWEVWKPGSDPEEQKAELGSSSASEQAVTPGTWDIRIRYEDGALCKADGWVRNVVVEAGKLWKAEAVVDAPMQYVRTYATLDGKDMADATRVELFKAGADMQELKPLTSFYTTQKYPVPAGNYDLRLTYEKDKVKANAIVKNLAVGADHGVLRKTVALVK